MTAFALALCLIFSFAASSGLCQSSTVIIPVEFRKVAEVLPIVKDLLSEDGKAGMDVRTNSIIVTDDDECIQEIRAFLERFDKPPRQVRVRVRFQEERLSRKRSFSTEGSVSGGNWRVTTGGKRRDGIDIRIHDSDRQQSKSSEYFINVLSGSPAYILAGKNIPYRERWTYLCDRYAGYVEQISLLSIESGMDVTPVIVGDHANIEITPRISHEVKRGLREIIRFTEASTTLSIPLGQWVTISATDEDSNEVIKEILAIESGEKNTFLSISLMVETY